MYDKTTKKYGGVKSRKKATMCKWKNSEGKRKKLKKFKVHKKKVRDSANECVGALKEYR